MKKKILIMANNLNIGGAQKSLVSFLQTLEESDYEVSLVLKEEGILSEYIPDYVKITIIPKRYKWLFIPKNDLFKALYASFGINSNFIKFIFFVIKGMVTGNMGISRQQLLESCMEEIPLCNEFYDVAIDYTGNYKAIIVNKINATKKITWVHSDYRVYKSDKKIDEKYFEKLDAIFTVSNTCHEILVSEFPHFKNKVTIMPNISNKEQITKMAMEKVNFDNNYSGIKILGITRLDPNKGIDIAIMACKKLLEDGYQVKWYILGEGSERQKVEEMIKNNKLENNFILLGLKSNPYPYIKKANLIVHCSMFEGKSVAIDEAMLLSKPIVLTNYPTAKDQIKNGVNGLICDISVEDVVNKIKILINNKELRDKLISNLNEFDLFPKFSMDKFNSIIN